MGRKKVTTEEFIKSAVGVHGDKFDYSETVYNSYKEPVKIKCIKHGVFYIEPYKHLKREGCVECDRINRLKDISTVIKDFKNVHDNRYDYSLVDYKGAKIKVKIICPEHGEFWQAPTDHLSGSGCPKCGRIKNIKSFKESVLSRRNWDFEQPEDYKLIPLTQGKFAMVDNEDFERLKDVNWYYSQGYAMNDNLGGMHRVIMNAPKDMLVDHKDIDNTLDNRRSNIRLATKAQNQYNQKPIKGKSIYKGVYRIKATNKWKASITHNGVPYRLGVFTCELEASIARDLKALELQGEFAYLNHPEKIDIYSRQLQNKNNG